MKTFSQLPLVSIILAVSLSASAGDMSKAQMPAATDAATQATTAKSAEVVAEAAADAADAEKKVCLDDRGVPVVCPSDESDEAEKPQPTE